MTGEIVQINVSPGGVPKLPVPAAMVTPLGLEGDRCAHPNIHGGPRQALLLIASEVIDQLAERGFRCATARLERTSPRAVSIRNRCVPVISSGWARPESN